MVGHRMMRQCGAPSYVPLPHALALIPLRGDQRHRQSQHFVPILLCSEAATTLSNAAALRPQLGRDAILYLKSDRWKELWHAMRGALVMCTVLVAVTEAEGRGGKPTLLGRLHVWLGEAAGLGLGHYDVATHGAVRPVPAPQQL